MPFFGNKRKDFSIQPPTQQVNATPFFVTDSANIDFTLSNLNLTANLTLTGVIAGTYGSSTQVPVLQIDQWGRITGVTLQTISSSGLALETNGTPNGDQTLLNLVAGTNMTITDDGLGNITFDATGGGGSGTVTSVGVTASTGISASVTNPTTTPNITITNTAPDQTVVLNSGTGISTSGTYPSFTITNTLPDQTVSLTAGTGIGISGTYPSFTISSTVTGGIPKGTASGTDTYTTTISGVTSYNDGDAYLIRFTNGNTTGCTLNINSLGARTLYRNNDGALIGGDIISGAEMLCVYNSTLNGFQTIGTAPNTLLGYVTNDDSVTITKGQVVYAFGGQGDRMTVKLANNTSDATSARTVGVVLSTSIAANQKGLIMMQGLLDGLNILPTATWSDGDPVYLGATAGSITKVKPYAPNHLVYVGIVTTASNGSAGRMYVNIQNGYELDELHNVQAQSPSLNDTLYYDSTVSPGQWKTTSVNTLLNTSIKTGSCGVTFDGGGQVIQTKTAYVQVPYNGTLTSWTLVADVSGSCTITVFKDTYANYPPTTTADDVYVTAPSLSSQQKNQNLTPTYIGSQATVTAGDYIGFTISAITTITWANLTIQITKT